MRWIASNCKGKKGECLYPGKTDPEASYQIDYILEISESYLKKFIAHSKPDCDDEKVREIAENDWV